MTEKKSRILYIKRFLEEHTDEEHPATIADIINYLSNQSIPAHQRTVMLDIEQLIEIGVDVVCNKSRQNQYFIGVRHFETPELKLLIDAVQASRFLTNKRSRTLVNKLLALTNRHQAKSLASSIYSGQIKQKNEKAYLAADLLLAAIQTKRRVRFMYYEYASDKKKEYKHGQRIYELSPWAFVWSEDSYYIIGHSKTHGKTAKFRVDRIAAPKLTELSAMPSPKGFDLAVYMQTTFKMYDGPLLDITLKCENAMMKTIVDRFDEDVRTSIADKGHFYAHVRVSASRTFYGWLFGMDGAIQIIAPVEALEAYDAMIKRVQNYSCIVL